MSLAPVFALSVARVESSDSGFKVSQEYLSRFMMGISWDCLGKLT